MRIKRCLLAIGAVLMVCLLGGCTMFTTQFMDYDVSGYLHALLDSSYKGENDNFINFSQSTESEAENNNQLTVANGAVYFCNAFGIYPTDEQMTQIEEFIRTAYGQTSYTVNDEEKVDTGYTVEITIRPLGVFRDLTDDFEEALNNVNYGSLESSTVEDSEVSEEANEEEAEGEEEESVASESSSSGSTGINKDELYVDEVIRICQEALEAEPQYDEETTIIMNIKLDEDGILYLDRTQLEEIDVMVIVFELDS